MKLGATLASACAAALMTSPAAFAQSGNQIYGQITAGLSQKNNTTGPRTELSDNILNGSYLGFRGVEDLGGGMRALFNLETSVGTDTGEAGEDGKFWNRQSYVGLGKDSLTLTVGRQFHASTDRVQRSLDAFNVSGSSLHVTPLALFGTNPFAGFDTRSDDTLKVRWDGPLGVTVGGSYSIDEGSGRSMAFDLAQITRTYTVAVYGAKFRAPDEIADAIGVRPVQNLLGAGGQFRFGGARLYLNVARSTRDALEPGGPQQVNTLVVPGIRYDMLPYIFRASYTHDSGKDINSVDGRDGKKKTFIGSVEYRFSERTALNFAVFNNSFTGGYQLDPVNIAALDRDPASSSTSGYSIGIRHNF